MKKNQKNLLIKQDREFSATIDRKRWERLDQSSFSDQELKFYNQRLNLSIKRNKIPSESAEKVKQWKKQNLKIWSKMTAHARKTATRKLTSKNTAKLEIISKKIEAINNKLPWRSFNPVEKSQ